jgi:hypothetical protein
MVREGLLAVILGFWVEEAGGSHSYCLLVVPTSGGR